MKYIVISDIHLAHLRTPTEYIIKNLYKYFLTEENKDVDVIFIGGDVYDRSIDVKSKENLNIMTFFGHLLNFCYNNNIQLRVLKGTPGHDYDQIEVLVTLNELRKEKEIGVDLKYFPILDIDYLDKFDKYVLFIPDEWSRDHDVIERDVRKRMEELGLTQVDIAITHSQFNHHIPNLPDHIFRYKEDFFLEIVKGFTHNAHVHTPNQFDRIITQGSFDRLAHGEEEDKGYVKVIDGDWTFIKNPDSFIYKTLRVTKNDTLATLDEKVSRYPEGSHIRFNLPKDNHFNLNFKDLILRYNAYRISRKVGDETEHQLMTNIISDEEFDMSDFDFINSDFRGTVESNILNKYELNESEKSKLKDYLEIFRGSESKEEE